MVDVRHHLEPREHVFSMTIGHVRSLLTLGVAFMAGMVAMAAARPSRAEAADPLQATSLTVAEASGLSQPRATISLPRLAALTPDVAAALLSQPIEVLDLPAIESLGPELAAALVRTDRLYELRLDAVKSLTPEAARALARHTSTLRLGGLESITPAVAAEFANACKQRCSLTELTLTLPPGTPVESLRELARVDHNLEFAGPVTITAEFAAAFAGFDKWLSLAGPVAPLSPEVARKLTFPGALEVEGAIELSDEVATILATRPSTTWITGLTRVTPGVARVLAGRSESLCLRRLRSLDAESAAALATHKGPVLEFDALESLSPEAARALTAFNGRLDMDSPVDIPAEIIAILATHRSWLDLGIETLSPEVATVLARHRGGLGLGSVTSLTPAAARGLAAAPGAIQLYRLATLDAETAAALATHRGDLDIPNLKSLPAEAARALMNLEGALNLDRLPAVDPALAQVLASRRGGPLLVKSQYELSPEVAEVLARNPNIRFPYWKLRSLTPEAAAGLAQWPEDLSLGCEAITPEAAAALAPHGKDLRLPGITALDAPDAVAVARALATKRGSVTLPSLKRITAAALMALAEKTEVDIDDFDTLEIVPGGDVGLGGDDYVLPTAFVERQRQSRR